MSRAVLRPSRQTRHSRPRRTLWADDPRLLGWTPGDKAIAFAPPHRPFNALAAPLTVLTDSDADAWIDAGFPRDEVRVEPWDATRCDALNGTDPADLERIAPDTGDAPLVVALADHPMHIDARVFAYQLSVCKVTSRTVVGILPRGCRHLDATRRHLRLVRYAPRIIESNIPTWRWLARAAVAIHFTQNPRSGADLVIRSAAEACGVPCMSVTPADSTHPWQARRIVRPLFDALQCV